MALDGAKVEANNLTIPDSTNTTIPYGTSADWDTSGGTYWNPSTNNAVINGPNAASKPLILVTFEWAGCPNNANYTILLMLNGSQVDRWTHYADGGTGPIADGFGSRYPLPANGTVSVQAFQNSGFGGVKLIKLSLDVEF